mmetsp:Transcript_15939/g.26863  ORF Transcript_15939/g.26863 Transcript_15939/m.26863 type:complete len:209 (+) Transcript_15939:179-805(+)
MQNCLLVPLSLYSETKELEGTKAASGYQDKAKLSSIFREITTQRQFLEMAIRCFHVYQSKGSFGTGSLTQNNSILEKHLKLLQSHLIKVSQTQHPDGGLPDSVFNNLKQEKRPGSFSGNLGAFLWQYVVYELFYGVLKTYSEGVRENIKKQVEDMLIPDDLFNLGKSICINLASFVQVNFHDSCASLASKEIDHLMIQNDLSNKQVAQ